MYAKYFSIYLQFSFRIRYYFCPFIFSFTMNINHKTHNLADD